MTAPLTIPALTKAGRKPPTPALRPYQLDHVALTHAKIAAGHRRILQVAPTGAGKTVTAAEIIRQYVRAGSASCFSPIGAS